MTLTPSTHTHTIKIGTKTYKTSESTHTHTETPPSSVIQVGPTDTPAAFLAALGNLNYNAVELLGGTYQWPLQSINIERPTAPLLVRPAAGAAIVFSGTAGGPAFWFGHGGKASDLAFDLPGVVFTDYSIGNTGIVWMGNVQRMRFGGTSAGRVVVQRVTCTGTGAIYSWAAYLSVDGGVAPSDTLLDWWDVRGTARNISALQVGHDGTAPLSNISAQHWLVDSVSISLYADDSVIVNGLTPNDWGITNSKRDDRPSTVHFGPKATGTFSNMRSDLGNLESQGGMTRGTGNVGI